jgi:5-methylcytosine-specific restriction endonuclease McrA
MRIVPHGPPSLFDGKVCTACGVWKLLDAFHPHKERRDGYASQCRDCANAATRKRRQEHPEARRAGDIHYRTTHKAEIAARDRAYQQKRAEGRPKRKRLTPEDRIAYRRAYRETHREEFRAHSKRYTRRHPDRVRATQRAYWQRHPEKKAMHAHRRRTREQAGGTYNDQQWQSLCDWFGGVCLACGLATALEVDHVIAVSTGGPNTIENLQPLCGTCNKSKGTRPLDYRDPEQLAAFLASLS